MLTERLGVVIAPRFWPRDPDYMYPYCLYLIRDAERVLYVGKAKLPANRVKEHVYNRRRDPIGLHIHEHKPASLDWMVDFLTLLDMGCQTQRNQPDYSYAVNKAERQLIAKHQPLFNSERSWWFRFIH